MPIPEGYVVATPLYAALRTGDSTYMELLLEMGADSSVTITETQAGSRSKVDLLLYSLIDNSVEKTKLLLSHGANPNFICEFKYDNGTRIEQPDLYYALHNNLSPEIVELFLKEGADTSIPRKEYKDGKLIDLTSPLSITVISGNNENIELLLRCGADPNGIKEKEVSPLLFFAVKNNTTIISELLLKSGADANARYKIVSDEIDCSQKLLVIYQAAANRNAEIVRLLLRYGADTEAIML